MALLIAWLVTVLPASTLAYLDNEKLLLLELARKQAIQVNIDPEKFILLAQCESGWNSTAKGDWSKERQIFLSRGLLQFQKPTFNAFSKKYGVEGEYLDPQAQILVASYMLRDKGQSHWFNCNKKIGWIK